MVEVEKFYAPPGGSSQVGGPDESPSAAMLVRPLLLYAAVLFLFGGFQLGLMALNLDPRVTIIITQVVIILGAALVYRKYFSHDRTRWPTFRGFGMSPVALGVVIIASVVLGLLGNLLGGLMIQIFPGLAPVAEQYQQTIESLLLVDDLWLQLLGVAGVVLVAPICEEVLFRGTILAEQRRGQLAAGAIVLNGVLFAAMHLNPVGFLSLMLIGCYFAHVTLRSGSIWGAILGHAALNLVNGVLLLRLAVDVAAPEELSLLPIVVGLVVFVPISAGLWWLSVRLIQSREGAARSEGRTSVEK